MRASGLESGLGGTSIRVMRGGRVAEVFSKEGLHRIGHFFGYRRGGVIVKVKWLVSIELRVTRFRADHFRADWR